MKHLYNAIFIAIFGAGILSCKKVTPVKATEKVENATMQIRTLEEQDRVGEDDEEEIIQGWLEDPNHTPIVGAAVSLLKSSDSTLTDSDTTSSTGSFGVSAFADEYLFKIVNGTNTPVYTNAFQLTEDIQMTIEL